jgi:hypothetical protein
MSIDHGSGPLAALHAYCAAHADEAITEAPVQLAGTRTFYPSDYARFARALRRARQVQGNPYQAKDQAHQDKIAGLVNVLAGVFYADSHEFSAERFIAGTQLPELAEPYATFEAEDGGQSSETPEHFPAHDADAEAGDALSWPSDDGPLPGDVAGGSYGYSGVE